MAAAASGRAATTTAASCHGWSRPIPRGTEDGKLPLYFSTRASGTGDSLAGRENELLEIVFATATSVFINGHGLFLFQLFFYFSLLAVSSD